MAILWKKISLHFKHCWPSLLLVVHQDHQLTAGVQETLSCLKMDQYSRPGWVWELLSQPDGLMIVLMKKKQKKDLWLIHWFHRQAYSFIRGRQCTTVTSNSSTIWSHVTINLNFGQRMLNTFLSESDHQDSLSNWQITIPPNPALCLQSLSCKPPTAEAVKPAVMTSRSSFYPRLPQISTGSV